MAEIPNVALKLAGRAENVLLVRQVLAGVAETVGLNPIEANDLSTAVTEACNNVVVHAYPSGTGSLEVEIFASTGAVEVVVRDHGSGIRPHGEAIEHSSAGIGLPVIHALTRRVEFTDLRGGGTEVRMEFATPLVDALEWPGEDGLELHRAGSSALDDTVEITLGPSGLACAVLPRVLAVLAARAHFSTDRISDMQALAAALAAGAEDSTPVRLAVAIDLAPRNLELRMGPLSSGRAARLIRGAAADGLGPLIDEFSEEPVVSDDRSEMLTLRLVEGS